MKIKKRDGTIVPFDETKITNAILKALTASGVPSESVAKRVTGDVVKKLSGDVVSVEDVQDQVEAALMTRGLLAPAKAYILYRDEHARARKSIRVRRVRGSKQSVTDQALLIVQSMTNNELTEWDRSRVVKRLQDALGIKTMEALSIAKDVEDLVIASGLRTVNSAFVRELINSVLIDRGYKGQLQDLTMYQVPRDFVQGLMHEKSVENSNIANNSPEAVSFDLASLILKQFALDTIFSPDVVEAHNHGSVHIHDLNFPHRLYCGSHSIEYLKKYGLKGLCNLSTTSKPARSASVLTGHLNTFLASMQAYYAGALGLGYINVFYAPYLVGMSEKEVKQIAQELIFNGSQNAFSRGGQTLFLDFNVHTGVPSYLANVPAIGPGGKYMFREADGNVVDLEEARIDDDWCLVYKKDGNNYAVLREHDGKQAFQYEELNLGKVLTYSDFDKEVKQMCKALLDVWDEGDAFGHVFEFPKLDFHVSAETFTDPEQYALFMRACEVTSHNGSTYFIFDRDSVSLASCCRLRVTITDMSLLLHPESLRTCGFGNVTINLPQCAYKAKHTKDVAPRDTDVFTLLLAEVDRIMDIAAKAHMQKKEFLSSIMVPGAPMWQIAKPANDGKPYMRLEDCVYIIGMIGLNDALEYLYGKQLHESDEMMELGLKLITHMFMRAKEYTKKYGVQFKLEESPAESAARRLAKTDLVYWRDDALKVFKGGSEDAAYYTNSIHLAASAPVGIVERIRKQSMYHSVIESGAIIHAFIGEEQPEPGAVADLVTKIWLDTQCAQITFSPEFTYCLACGSVQRGLKETCNACGSKDVVGETRVVGYFSRIQNWTKSKRYGELVDRHKGQYNIMQAGGEDEKA